MKKIMAFKHSIICGLLIILSFIVPESLKQLMLILAIVLGSYTQTLEGIQDTYENKRINVELLMILSAIGAVFIGEPLEGATLVFIFSVSGELETLTQDRSQKEIRKLMNNQPLKARVVDSVGKYREIPLEDLKSGDIVSVFKGETVSADGIIIDGVSDFDEAMITGESVPVLKGLNQRVFTGTLNITNPIKIKVDQAPEDALIRKIVRLVEQAEGEKSKIATTIERIESVYATLILIGVTCVYITLRFYLKWEHDAALYRSIVLLVVASPCALIASVTPATLAAIAANAKRGVLIKGGTYLEHLRNIRAIAFDKTGTLTLGKPQVINDYFLEDCIGIVRRIESHSTHPLAKAITEYYLDDKTDYDIKELDDINGVGLSAIYQDNLYQIGRFQVSNNNFNSMDAYQNMKDRGMSTVCVYKNHECIGVIGLQDTIREESKVFINKLKEYDIEPVMLTGDQELSAKRVATELGISNYVANCMPEDKVNIINELKKNYENIMMVGDGINDAPALAQATLGVSIGAGSDIAIESSDMVLMNSNLMNLIDALESSYKLNKVIKQNITFSLLVIVVLVILNLSGNINLPLGVIGHEGSTILVILNGMRLLKQKG